MRRVLPMTLIGGVLAGCGLDVGVNLGGGSSSGVGVGVGVHKEVGTADAGQDEDGRASRKNEPPPGPVDDKPPGFD